MGFPRTDSLNDGPILDRITVLEGEPAPEGLKTHLRSSGTEMFPYQLYHNPLKSGTGLFRRLLQTPDGRTRMFFRTWQTFIQPVSPGLVARWILYPPQDVRTVGPKEWRLWRYEGPNKILNVEPLDWMLGVNNAANQAWIRSSYNTPPQAISTDRGRVWVDGGGIPYGVETSAGWMPTALPVTFPWYWLNGNPNSLNQMETDVVPSDLVYNVKKGREYTSGAHPGIFLPWTFGPEFFAARDSLAFTDDQIKRMRPAEIVRLYYGMGKWVEGENCPVYQSPYWPQPASSPSSLGTYAAVVEYQLRDRIYTLRPDLHKVALADGSDIPGLISYREFPPQDGLQCKDKGGIVGIADAFNLVASFLPGIGIWTSLIQYSTQLADMLQQLELKGKVGALTTNLTTGASALTAVDALTPTGPTDSNDKSNKTGNTGLLLVLGAVAAAMIAGK